MTISFTTLSNNLIAQEKKVLAEKLKEGALKKDLFRHITNLITDSLSVWGRVKPSLAEQIYSYGTEHGFVFSDKDYDESNLDEIVWQIGNHLPIFNDSCTLISEYKFTIKDVKDILIKDSKEQLNIDVVFKEMDGFNFVIDRLLLSIYFNEHYSPSHGNYKDLEAYMLARIEQIELPAFKERCPDSPANRRTRLMEEAAALGFDLVPKK